MNERAIKVTINRRRPNSVTVLVDTLLKDGNRLQSSAVITNAIEVKEVVSGHNDGVAKFQATNGSAEMNRVHQLANAQALKYSQKEDES